MPQKKKKRAPDSFLYGNTFWNLCAVFTFLTVIATAQWINTLDTGRILAQVQLTQTTSPSSNTSTTSQITSTTTSSSSSSEDLCGNGVEDPGEQCDPGKPHCEGNTTFCSSPTDCSGAPCIKDSEFCWHDHPITGKHCVFRMCGDEYVEPDGPDGNPNTFLDNEECDVGWVCSDDTSVKCRENPDICIDQGIGFCGVNHTDTCWSDCRLRQCGDGITETRPDGTVEQCDTGKTCEVPLCDCYEPFCFPGDTPCDRKCVVDSDCTDLYSTATCVLKDTGSCWMTDELGVPCIKRECGDGVIEERRPDKGIEECDDGKRCNYLDPNNVLVETNIDCTYDSLACDSLPDPHACIHLSTESCWATCLDRGCGDGMVEPHGPDGIAGTSDDEKCDAKEICVDPMCDCWQSLDYTGDCTVANGKRPCDIPCETNQDCSNSTETFGGYCEHRDSPTCWILSVLPDSPPACSERWCGDGITDLMGGDGFWGTDDDEACDNGLGCVGDNYATPCHEMGENIEECGLYADTYCSIFGTPECGDNCQPTSCGDEVVQGTEECDDGILNLPEYLVKDSAGMRSLRDDIQMFQNELVRISNKITQIQQEMQGLDPAGSDFAYLQSKLHYYQSQRIFVQAMLDGRLSDLEKIKNAKCLYDCTKPQCSDEEDNDKDNKTDCDDSGCMFGLPFFESCHTGVNSEENCGDGKQQAGEECDRGTANIPLDIANYSQLAKKYHLLSPDQQAMLKDPDACLAELCEHPQCSDGEDNEDNDTPALADGNDPGCKEGTDILWGKNSEDDGLCKPLFEDRLTDDTLDYKKADAVHVVFTFFGHETDTVNVGSAQASANRLEAYSPFKEAQNGPDKIYFWYVDKMFFPEAPIYEPFDLHDKFCWEMCNPTESCPDVVGYQTTLCNYRCRSTAGNTSKTSLKEPHFENVYVHEFGGHQFGDRVDEYSTRPPGYAPVTGANCAIDITSAFMTWEDNVGEGAGQLYVTSPYMNPVYGCGYDTTHVKPTQNSVMANSSTPPADGFGPVNIEDIEAKLSAYSGNVPPLPPVALEGNDNTSFRKSLFAQLIDTGDPPPAQTSCFNEPLLRVTVQRGSNGLFSVAAVESDHSSIGVKPAFKDGHVVRVTAGDYIFTQTFPSAQALSTMPKYISEDFEEDGTISLADNVTESIDELDVEVGLGDVEIDGDEAVLPDGSRMPFTVTVEPCTNFDDNPDNNCPPPQLCGKPMEGILSDIFIWRRAETQPGVNLVRDVSNVILPCRTSGGVFNLLTEAFSSLAETVRFWVYEYTGNERLTQKFDGKVYISPAENAASGPYDLPELMEIDPEKTYYFTAEQGPDTLTFKCDVGFDVAETTCGNAVFETGEGCDDGNLEDNDGCSKECLVERPVFTCENVLGQTSVCEFLPPELPGGEE